MINSSQAAKRKLHKAGGDGSGGNRGAGQGGQHPSLRQRKRGRGPQGPSPPQRPQQPQLPAGLVPSMGGAGSVVDALAARAQRAMGLGEGPEWLLRYPPGPQRLVAEVGLKSHDKDKSIHSVDRLFKRMIYIYYTKIGTEARGGAAPHAGGHDAAQAEHQPVRPHTPNKKPMVKEKLTHAR